jgi:DNA (cytosine-5)-methyltransferase 1
MEGRPGSVLRVNFSLGARAPSPAKSPFSTKDLSTRLVADGRFPHGARPYTVREYARLQGVPDTFTFAGGESDAYRMIGNGVSVPVGKWIGAEIARYFQ